MIPVTFSGANTVHDYDSRVATRPVVRSHRGVVASGHMLSALAGLDILRRGGNAIDAGVAAGICLNVVHHDMTTFSGVAPIAIYQASTGRVTTIDGVGRWPRRASLDYFWKEQGGRFVRGIKHCVLPAAADAWLTALERYGTMTLADVMEAAIDYARNGFPVHDFMAYNFHAGWESIKDWPGSRALVAPDGVLLRPGDIIVQADLADTLSKMVEAEKAARGTREERIRAGRNRFYQGDIADAFVAFSQQHEGFFTHDDFREFHVKEEPPVRLHYKGYEVIACGPWSQGPVLLQALAILQHVDLPSLGHNSPRYLHTVMEALKLAFADREFYYGDPEFVDVPLEQLLSDTYSEKRASLIRDGEAWRELPPPGDPLTGHSRRDDYRWPPAGEWAPQSVAAPPAPPHDEPDTSYVLAIDGEGNMFSATPSDSFTTALAGPVVPGLGLPLSGRGRQSRLDPRHPAAIAPWKRPRLTPNPVLVLKDGRPWLAIGSPGADVQPQAILQVFLNIVEFGMDLQEAVEAPRAATYSYPASFYPHAYRPGLLRVEQGIPDATVDTLRSWGHEVERWSHRAWRAGSVCVGGAPSPEGVWQAAADFRREAVALGI